MKLVFMQTLWKKYLKPVSLYSGPLNGTEKYLIFGCINIYIYAIMRKGFKIFGMLVQTVKGYKNGCNEVTLLLEIDEKKF